MDESRIGQYSISVTTYPIMALQKPKVSIFRFMQPNECPDLCQHRARHPFGKIPLV